MLQHPLPWELPLLILLPYSMAAGVHVALTPTCRSISSFPTIFTCFRVYYCSSTDRGHILGATVCDFGA
jgi:hypothetical protein